MTVTEFVILEIVTNFGEDHPQIEPNSPSIVANLFKSLASIQQNASKFPVLFFSDSHEKSRIYLLSGWQDVDSHLEWMKTEESLELLKAFGPRFRAEAFRHLDIDFEDILEGAKTITCEKPPGTLRLGNASPVWVRQGKDITSTAQEEYQLSGYREVVELEGVVSPDVVTMHLIDLDHLNLF